MMRKFSEQYARGSGTYFCMDKSVTAVVIQGLAEHKDTLGSPLCPCRHYDDKEAEVAQGFWNCPCVPMRERKECHCACARDATTRRTNRALFESHDERSFTDFAPLVEQACSS